jgi:TonB-linked outer membrane protein, SusC/RagA family
MKNLTKKLTLVVLCLGFALVANAQALTVKGVVTDPSGEPLIGVSVMIEGTQLGTTTGIDGDYSLSVPDASKNNLVFSYIGMKDQVIKVGNRAVIDVSMEDDNTFLDEVVVVGYATVKRRDLMGSVASVGSEKLAEQPVTTVSQALSGKMAGVSVTTTEGDPDADIKIRVRGGGSITQDNSPLYIVDGFPVESINDIASSEIQSIDVLKDAFSTAIYGSRGANGVVIVTTKGGEKGRKVSVNLNAYYGFKKMANAQAIQPMNSENFVKFQYELAKIRDNVSDNYEPYFGTFNDIDLYSGLATNDWVDMVFGNTGTTLSTDLSISGSGDNYRWTLGYAHMGDNAIMMGSNYIRDNLSMKAQYQPSKKTTFDVNVRYSKTNVRGSGANGINDTGTTSGNGRLKHAVSYSPIPVSSTLQNVDEEADYGDNAPPLRSVADNDSKRVRTSWVANAAFTWEIIKNLKLKIDGGIEDFRQNDNRFYGLTTYYVTNSATYKETPANQYKDLTRNKYRNTNTLTYNFAEVFKGSKHSLDLLLGEEMTITKSNTYTAMVENFPTFYDAEMAWNFMSSGTPVSNVNYFSPDDNMLSFFGRANYDFDHRYSLSATVRADGSSKFAKANRWGVFPSAAVSWTISNESWMKDAQWIDQLKLRYSFGSAGNNNIPSGQINKEYSATTTSWLSTAGSYWMAGKIMNNPDLKWETTYTNNIGLDFGFFGGKVSGSIEVYQNDTKDLLINFPIAGSGYDSQYRNIGSTRNRGAELTLNLPLISEVNYGLNISGNISYNKNQVMSLGGLESIVAESYWASTEIGSDYIVEVGKPLGNMYGYRSDGMYLPSDFDYVNGKWVLKSGVTDCSSIIGSSYMRPGAMKLKDLNGDGKVTVADREVIGNASPDFQGGFSISGYAFGFDLSANFTYMIGNQVYNANKVEFTSSRKFYNRNLINKMDVDNRWTGIDWNTGELIADAATLNSVNAGVTMWSPFVSQAVFSDWAVEDASFLRLQSATIGYTIPDKLTKKIYMRKLRVYATGTNLFCLTKYSGYDPEVDTRRATPLTPGVDYSAYPKSRGFVFGINITF